MSVDDVAARGFGGSADRYERYRPSYPDDAVSWLAEQCRLDHADRVCDLGAGTGKLTRLVAARSDRVVAVEPLAGMITVLHRELPHVPAASAVAEAMPVRAGAFDAVVAGQAFHWFDLDLALPELHRVLGPGGRVGMVWNGWDDSEPWVRDVRDLVARSGASEQWLKGHLDDAWLQDPIGASPLFGALHHEVFQHAHRATIDAVVERVATTSHIAAKPAAERDAVLAETRAILAAHLSERQEIDFPYRVDAYWTERT